MRCPRALADEPHPPHWHIVRADGITVAQGQCGGVPPRTGGTVEVDVDDLRRILASGSGHAHTRPGVWDWDNREHAGVACTLCPAYDRLLTAVGGPATLPSPHLKP